MADAGDASRSSKVRKLSQADYLAMPWKNGGGVTTQLAIHPAGAGLDDFDWRISMARVSASGTFSRFAGVDRSLAIVDGAGLKLAMAGRLPLHIDGASDILAFAGEESVESVLVDGAVTDFNVMTRRAAWSHSLERLQLHGSVTLEGADEIVVYCARGAVCAGELFLAANEALRAASRAALHLHADAPALLYLARLHRTVKTAAAPA